MILGLATVVVCACGQATRNDEPRGEAGMGAGGASIATGGTPGAGKGNEATGGATFDPTPGNPISGVSLDEAFPWFLVESGSSATSVVTARPDDGVLHVDFADAPVRATLSTHHHFEVLSVAQRVEFSAQTSEDVVLRVSVKRALTTSDYFTATESPWPTTT
ncbi:MAG TPA: hypothetical protein VIM73_01285, partial [Polyangiaceae bacterium]